MKTLAGRRYKEKQNKNIFHEFNYQFQIICLINIKKDEIKMFQEKCCFLKSKFIIKSLIFHPKMELTLPPEILLSAPINNKLIHTHHSEDRLIILDVDGLFIKRTYDPSLDAFKMIDNTHFEAPRFRIELRKDAISFLEALISNTSRGSKHLPKRAVGLWTSSKSSTFTSYLPRIFGDLFRCFEFVWDRSMCTLDPDYQKNPLIKAHSTIKPLSTVLTNPMINENRRWTADNVIIVDDSELKLRFNPLASSRIINWEDNIMSLLEELL